MTSGVPVRRAPRGVTCKYDSAHIDHGEHIGWIHAPSWRAVSDALEEGRDAYDTDGRFVVLAEPDDDGTSDWSYHWVRPGDELCEDNEESTCRADRHHGVILIPDEDAFVPPSDEEIAATIRSIAGLADG